LVRVKEGGGAGAGVTGGEPFGAEKRNNNLISLIE